ncbi:MAG: hypothetical protein R2792_05425 [Saprospiraceae bacterium]
MNRSIKTLLSLFVLLALFSACRKDTIKDTTVIITPDPSIKVETGVRGLVTDEMGNALQGATVTLGTETTLTDDIGYFYLEGLASQLQGFIRVEKAGFYPSFASFSPKVGDVSRVLVSLRSKNLTAQIDAAAGGVVNVPGGGSVEFAPNSFVDAAGNAYSGQVSVYATYLDPSDAAINRLVTDSYLGLSEEGEAQMLVSYGMIHVVIEGNGGQKLQINQSATLNVPVPADRISDAPASIPLWYFDEATGLWEEEGQAELSGSMYTGTVEHFSLWNCDIGIPTVYLSGNIRLGANAPFVFVRVTRLNGFGFATATTNESGNFGGLVPANEDLLFEIIDECGNVVYSQNIGPLTDDLDLGAISLTLPATSVVEISGTLVDCDQNPVTNGIAQVWIGSQARIPLPVDEVTGEFSASLISCTLDEDITIIGYDFSALLYSDPLVESYASSIDFGDVPVCDNQIIVGVQYDYNGGSYFIDNAVATVNADTLGLTEITVVDDQGNGNKVIYTYTLINWGSSSNPVWGMSYNTTLFGSPTVYTPTGNYTINSVQYNTDPGEIIIFEVAGGLLKEDRAEQLTLI